MSYSFFCKICPMKFTNEADLQIHGQVHIESRHADSYYDFDANTEPLFNEFLTAFFPDMNDSYIPALNDFSHPDHLDPAEDTSSLSSAEDDVIYTTLTTMKIPGGSSEKATGSESSSGGLTSVPLKKSTSKGKRNQSAQSSAKKQSTSSVFLKKLPSAVRFVNTSNVEAFQPGSHQFNKSVLKPVYIARRPPSIAMIQHHYGDDRIEGYPQYHKSLLQPAILTKCLTGIAKVSIRNPSLSSPVPESKEVDGKRPGIAVADPAKRVLKRSRRSTIGEKPYCCEVCDKRFAFIKKFIAHKRIHIVGKLFSCYLCHKRFGYSYKLNQHMRLHTGENTEECNSCKKTYKNLTYLRRHRCRGKKLSRKGIAKARPYACTVCKRTFGRINYLNLHKRCHIDKEDPQNQERVLPLEFLQDP